TPCSAFEVTLEPPVLLVQYGRSLNFSCSTACTDPLTPGRVETAVRYNSHSPSNTVTEVTLLNVTAWNSTVQCYFNCSQGSGRAEAELIVVSPVRNLTVTLRLGDSTLHTATFQGHSQQQPEEVLVTHVVTVRREDHGQNVTCQAMLDLQLHGPLLTTTSTAQVLDIYEFPEDPILTTGGAPLETTGEIHLETGEELNVTCSVGDVFPTANVTLLLDRHPLQPLPGNSRSVAVRGLLWEHPERHHLLCSAQVGPRKRTTEAVIYVYNFPPPQLRVSNRVPVVMSNVTGNCTLPYGHSEGIQLQVTVGQRQLVPWRYSPLFFTLTVTENDTELRCEAKLPGEGRIPTRSDVVTLSVTTPPRMDANDCPPSYKWTEGQEVTLRCHARGRPRPVVTCHGNGTTIPVGRPYIVTRNYSGTYWCSATNVLGTTGRSVVVTVEYWDVNVGAVVAVAVVLAAAAVGGAVTYRVYYHKKKIRQYKLQKEQQRLLAMGQLTEAATAAQNGSAPGSQP
ncbi:hypothetical protein ASZ78_008431, partial [Callipepla squamata]